MAERQTHLIVDEGIVVKGLDNEEAIVDKEFITKAVLIEEEDEKSDMESIDLSGERGIPISQTTPGLHYVFSSNVDVQLTYCIDSGSWIEQVKSMKENSGINEADRKSKAQSKRRCATLGAVGGFPFEPGIPKKIQHAVRGVLSVCFHYLLPSSTDKMMHLWDLSTKCCNVKVEINIDERNGAERVLVSLTDPKIFSNDLMLNQSKKVLHLISGNIHSMTFKVLIHQVHRTEVLPKPMYKGEDSERITEFSPSHSRGGKTMTTRELARKSSLDYALMARENVAPLGSHAVTKIHQLFDLAKKSNRGLLLFIDEAHAFLCKRNKTYTSEAQRSALNVLSSRMCDQSNDIVLIVATNRTGDLDSAVADRIDEVLEFPLPGEDELFKLLKLMASAQTAVYGSENYLLDHNLLSKVVEWTTEENQNRNLVVRMTNARKFVRNLLAANWNSEGCPYLAHLERERRNLLFWKDDADKVVEDMIQNIIRLCYLACFTADVEMVFQVLKKSEFLKKLVKEKCFHKLPRTAENWDVSRSRFWGTSILYNSEEGEEITVEHSSGKLKKLSETKVDDELYRWFGSKLNACIHYPFDSAELIQNESYVHLRIEGLKQVHKSSIMELSTKKSGKLASNDIKNKGIYYVGFNFQKLSVEGAKKMSEKALAKVEQSSRDIHSVEVIGSCSRVPAVLSSTFNVLNFQTKESFTLPIASSWESVTSNSQERAWNNQQTILVFLGGKCIPSILALTFYGYSTSIVGIYANYGYKLWDNLVATIYNEGRLWGLGDFQEIGIAIEKLDLYVAAVGIKPQRLLLVRIMDTIFIRWPHLIVQFEDFQSKWAFKPLQRHRDEYRMFNDDVDETLGVALADLLRTMRRQGRSMIDFRKMNMVVARSAEKGVLSAARKTMGSILGVGDDCSLRDGAAADGDNIYSSRRRPPPEPPPVAYEFLFLHMVITVVALRTRLI